MNSNQLVFSHFDEKIKEEFQNSCSTFQLPQSRNSLNILFIGTCFQEDFLKPMLDVLLDMHGVVLEKLNVFTIVSESNEGLYRNMREGNLFPTSILSNEIDFTAKNDGYQFYNKRRDVSTEVNFYPNQTPISDIHEKWKINFNERIQINIDKVFESETKSNPSLVNDQGNLKFDIIYCCFELHFCKNWRLALYHVLDLLRDNGNLIFTEVTGEFSLLDGIFPMELNAKTSNKIQLKEFFEDFAKARSKYHYWKPEISFSNYGELSNFVSTFFHEPIDKKIVVQDENRVIDIHLDEMIEYIKNGKFLYFKNGLTEEERGSLAEKMNQRLDSLPVDFNFKYGLNLYCFKKFIRRKFDRIEEAHWSYSTFSKNIQELDEFDQEKLCKKALDVIASHDVIVPDLTVFIGIFAWKENFSDARQKLHLLINKKLFTEYYNIEKDDKQGIPKLLASYQQNVVETDRNLGTNIFNIVFRETELKYPISFQNYDDSRHQVIQKGEHYSDNIPYEVEYATAGLYKYWVAYKIVYNSTGAIQLIFLAFSNSFIEDHLNAKAEIFLQSSDSRASGQIARSISTKQIIVDYLHKATLTLDINPVASGKSAMPREIEWAINWLSAKLSPFFFRLPNGNTNKKKRINLFRNLLLTQFGQNRLNRNYQITYFPAAVLDRQRNAEADARLDLVENQIGLGGIIIKERIVENSREFDIGFKYKDQNWVTQARNKVLLRITNSILYKVGLRNYVNQDFKKHARRSSIAAISARNVSHNMGSHVIPHIKSLLDEYVDDSALGDKYRQNFSHGISLFDYIQQRNDFINQLTSGNAGWSISTWFVREVIYRFQKQFYLLEGIAKFEGLKAMEYSANHFHVAQNIIHNGSTDENQQIILKGKFENVEEIEDGVECIFAVYPYPLRDKVLVFFDLEFIKKNNRSRREFYSILKFNKEQYFNLEGTIRRVNGQYILSDPVFHKYFYFLENIAEFDTLSSIKYRACLFFAAQKMESFNDISGSISIAIKGKFVDVLEMSEGVKCKFDVYPKSSEVQLVVFFDFKFINKYHKTQREFCRMLKSQKKRYFNLKGKIKQEKGQLILLDPIFIENNIVLKIRKRQFVKIVKYDHIARKFKVSRQNHSHFLHRLEGDCFNIAARGNEWNSVLASLKSEQWKYYYGIIEQIDLENNRVKLLFYKPFWVVFRSDLSAILKDKVFGKDFTIGARIIFSKTNDLTIKSDFLEMKDSKILELVRSEDLVDEYLGTKSSIVNGDMKVSIPGGLPGFQAFYTIIENIIRNASKHNWALLALEERLGRNLEVVVEMDDQNHNRYYVCRVWSNAGDLRYENGVAKYLNSNRAPVGCPYPNFKFSKIDAINKRLNRVIAQDIINTEGTFARESLGMAEIKINCAYLASLDIDFIQEKYMVGENLLLQEKKPKSELGGIMRASQIYEEFGNELVPRLAYRFLLQKPRDLGIIVEKSSVESFFGELDISKDCFVNTHSVKAYEQTGSLDFDIGLLVPFPEEYIQHADLNPIANLIASFYAHFYSDDLNSKEKCKEIFDDIFSRIENYPQRLIIILTGQSNAMVRKIIVKDLGIDNDGPLKEMFLILRRRAFLLSFDRWQSIKKDIGVNGDVFNHLYHNWLKIFSSQKEYHSLIVDLSKDGKNNIRLRHETFPSVSKELFDAETTGSNFFKKSFDRFEIFEKHEQKKNKINLIYSRHSNDSRIGQIETRFVENLSGTKTSLKLFSFPDRWTETGPEILRFKLRLIENGLISILILDERIVKYYCELKNNDSIKNFIRSGIIIPHYAKLLKETDPILNREANSWEKLREKGKHLKSVSLQYKPILEEDDLIGKLGIELKYFDTGFKGLHSDGLINTLIIHQSILDKALEVTNKKTEKEKRQFARGLVYGLKTIFPSVIITSGRSKSTVYSEFTKFLPFSVLEELVMTKNPDKLALTHIVFKTLK